MLGHLREAGERGPQREERHPRDVVRPARLEDRVAHPVEDTVRVLHAHDAGRQGRRQLLGTHVAQPDPADLARVTQGDQLRELTVQVHPLVPLGQEAGRRVGAAQVDHGHVVGPQGGEVGLQARPQLLGPLCEDQLIADVLRADLGGQHQVVRVRVPCRADHRVARLVELRGVEVVDPPRDDMAQERDGVLLVEAGQVHGAVPDPVDRAAGDGRAHVHAPIVRTSGGSSAITVAETEEPPIKGRGPGRTVRADAQRNRENLLAAARRAFTAGDAAVALEAIARDAGVGIGTLYRHFPTREALVEAVYRAERDRLCDSADELLATHRPDDALRAWMDQFADYVALKRDMADTLRRIIASGAVTPSEAREQLSGAAATLLDAGAAAGTIRADVRPEDVVVSLVGIFLICGDPGQRDQANRLLDLLMAGLRAH